MLVNVTSLRYEARAAALGAAGAGAMAVDTATVTEAFATLRSGNEIGGRHQLAALDTLCKLLDRAQSDEECAALGSTARAVSGIQLLGRLLPQAAAWAHAQPTDEVGCMEDRLQLLRRLLFVLSNLCSQAVDPRCGETKQLLAGCEGFDAALCACLAIEDEGVVRFAAALVLNLSDDARWVEIMGERVRPQLEMLQTHAVDAPTRDLAHDALENMAVLPRPEARGLDAAATRLPLIGASPRNSGLHVTSQQSCAALGRAHRSALGRSGTGGEGEVSPVGESYDEDDFDLDEDYEDDEDYDLDEDQGGGAAAAASNAPPYSAAPPPPPPQDAPPALRAPRRAPRLHPQPPPPPPPQPPPPQPPSPSPPPPPQLSSPPPRRAPRLHPQPPPPPPPPPATTPTTLRLPRVQPPHLRLPATSPKHVALPPAKAVAPPQPQQPQQPQPQQPQPKALPPQLPNAPKPPPKPPPPPKPQATVLALRTATTAAVPQPASPGPSDISPMKLLRREAELRRESEQLRAQAQLRLSTTDRLLHRAASGRPLWGNGAEEGAGPPRSIRASRLLLAGRASAASSVPASLPLDILPPTVAPAMLLASTLREPDGSPRAGLGPRERERLEAQEKLQVWRQAEAAVHARLAAEAARNEASRSRRRTREAQRQLDEGRQRKRWQAQRSQHARQLEDGRQEERAQAHEAKAAQARQRESGFHRVGFVAGTGAAATPVTGFKLGAGFMLGEPSWRAASGGHDSARPLDCRVHVEHVKLR